MKRLCRKACSKFVNLQNKDGAFLDMLNSQMPISKNFESDYILNKLHLLLHKFQDLYPIWTSQENQIAAWS